MRTETLIPPRHPRDGCCAGPVLTPVFPLRSLPVHGSKPRLGDRIPMSWLPSAGSRRSSAPNSHTRVLEWEREGDDVRASLGDVGSTDALELRLCPRTPGNSSMTRLVRWNAIAGLVAAVGTGASAQSVLVGPGRSFETNQANARLSCVRAAGDVNGDGFGDVIASAPLFDRLQVDAGSAWLFLGSNTGLAIAPTWSSSGPDQTSAHFGAQIAAAGDVDGDGYDDVLVSAPGYSNPEVGEGTVFFYRGAPSGLSPIAAWTFEGNLAGASVSSVGTAGDLNHDGYADVLIGVVDPAGAGRVHIFYGRASGLTATPNWTLDGSLLGVQPGEQFGSAVTSAGDVDADGFDDFLAASAQFTGGGRVWLFRGAATLPSTTPA